MSDSTEARIVAALDPIVPTWNAIKENSEHAQENEPKVYCTFTVNTRGDAYADDDPTVEVALCTAYLHAPLAMNISSLVRRMKQAIHSAGFTWPEKIDASDDKERRIALEFAEAIGVDLDGDI